MASAAVETEINSSTLDLFLDEINEKHVKFQIEENEVNFIQKCIERIVGIIARQLRYFLHDLIFHLTERNLIINPHLRVFNSDCEDNEVVIKAGSFYEGTKVGFPDEFDFIFLLCTFQCRSKSKLRHNIKHKADIRNLTSVVMDVLKFESVQKSILSVCQKNIVEKRGIFPIDFKRFAKYTGPSTKLHFKYLRNVDEPSTAVDIHVDFVPVIRIIDPYLRLKIHKICKLPEFADEIVHTGSILFVDGKISFTETEIRFMKRILSPEHRLVYKFLKVLLRGNSDQIKQCEHEFQPLTTHYHRNIGLPSFQIKSAIIFHHYKCQHDQKENMSTCLLEIIEDLKTGFRTNPFLRSLCYSKRLTTPKIIKYPFDRLGMEYFRATHKIETFLELESLSEMLINMQQDSGPLTMWQVPYPVAVNVARKDFGDSFPKWPKEIPYFLQESFAYSSENDVLFLEKDGTTVTRLNTVPAARRPDISVIEDIASFYHHNCVTGTMVKQRCAKYGLRTTGYFGERVMAHLNRLEQDAVCDWLPESQKAQGEQMREEKSRFSGCLRRIYCGKLKRQQFREAKAWVKKLKEAEESIGMILVLDEREHAGDELQLNRFFQQMTIALVYEARIEKAQRSLKLLES